MIGCAGYVQGVIFAGDRGDNCDRRSEAAGEVDTACEELRDRATIYILMAVSSEAFKCIIQSCVCC